MDEHIRLLPPTATCRDEGHQIATGQVVVGNELRAVDGTVCLTCTEAQGYLRGLRAWQEACPCCFSQAHPEGVPKVAAAD